MLIGSFSNIQTLKINFRNNRSECTDLNDWTSLLLKILFSLIILFGENDVQVTETLQRIFQALSF